MFSLFSLWLPLPRHSESLGTLQFANRAKHIRNKAVVNFDSTGTVSQLEGEVLRLRRQLKSVVSSTGHAGKLEKLRLGDSRLTQLEMLLATSLEREETTSSQVMHLLQKISALKLLVGQKEKQVQSMAGSLSLRESALQSAEQEKCLTVADEVEALRAEVQQLREQLRNHPDVTRYALENLELR
jgi:kinesin family member 15